MSHVYEKAALHILDWLHHAERDLVGKAISTFNGEVGAVQAVKLDANHGLCFTIDRDPHRIFRDALGPVRWYPISTIKQKER